MTFNFTYQDDAVTLTVNHPSKHFLVSLFSRPPKETLDTLSQKNRQITFALADLKELGDRYNEQITISDQSITFSHRLCSLLDAATAQVLNLPQLCELTFQTDVEGTVGMPNFRLRYHWAKNGKTQSVHRTGSILQTSQGKRRIPHWLLEAIHIAENYKQTNDLPAQWEALARFRYALEPNVGIIEANPTDKIAMTHFLKDLKINLVDSLSISVSPGDLSKFKIIPFSGDALHQKLANGDLISEQESLLDAHALESFQTKASLHGSRPAYHLAGTGYVVIDPSVQPVFNEMLEIQKRSKEERVQFVQNPQSVITQVIAEDLRSRGQFEGLSPAQEETLIEELSRSVFIETQEYSERVIGLVQYQKDSGLIDTAHTMTWLPEIIPQKTSAILDDMTIAQLTVVKEAIVDAIKSGDNKILLDESKRIFLPASQELIDSLTRRIQTLEDISDPIDPIITKEPDAAHNPIIIGIKENNETLNWLPNSKPRYALIPESIPAGVKTKPRDYQCNSFYHQVSAWKTGLPGILNADEQGLGKTLQTIMFLRWIQDRQSVAIEQGIKTGPILVVAPTSLLENWGKEVSHHLDNAGLGHVIKLYGSELHQQKRKDAGGVETKDGRELLNLQQLKDAIDEGKGHRFWILTTYTTLTNYQHSLSKIPFSVAVFDEVQAVKNPNTLAAKAARAMKVDFVIGLTGTPVENSTTDLWAIMDLVCPSALGTLKTFKETYATTNPDDLLSLHQQIFEPTSKFPAIAFRRLKEDVASELPSKTRYLHPRLMPQEQIIAYDDARKMLSSQGGSVALKALQLIRGVSIHPAVDIVHNYENYIAASARLTACIDILKRIQEKKERVLVFIEHRQMQFRFVELAKQIFGLNQIDIINGETPIKKRQEIVDRFQQHLNHEDVFDILVLGPKSAGTGLTLTAATHVIHLSRWWNPAVEEQCNDRVHRIGQKHPVNIHIPMAIHPDYQDDSFDCLLQILMSHKRTLARNVLWPQGVSEGDEAQLLNGLKGGERVNLGEDDMNDILGFSIKMMLNKCGEKSCVANEYGAYLLS